MDFIDKFVEMTDERPSPALFRKWAAITTLSGALEKRVWTMTKAGPQFANLYTMLVAPPGIGKCLRFGEQVLTYEGKSVPVETLVEGDLLIGPDGQSRKVLSNSPGFGRLYKVSPRKGRAWYCNGDHILSLRKSRAPNTGTIKFVTVNEWLQWNPWQKSEWKLWRTGVQSFSPKPTPIIDPYFLGLLLGDGDSDVRNGIVITTADQEIVSYVQEQAVEWGLTVSRYGSYRYALVQLEQRQNSLHVEINKILTDIKCGTKFVPEQYRSGSYSTRLQLLAGLLDADGSLCPSNSFDFISKSPQLAQDVAFLSRSLGLFANIKSCFKTCGTFVGEYWRVIISGDIDIIPCKIERKKAKPRRQIKNPLNTGFNITLSDEGWWAGLAVDGDNQFLLDDFTVIHNSQAINPAESLLKATRKFKIAPNSVTGASFIDALAKAGTSFIISPSQKLEYHSLFVFAAELGVFLNSYDLGFLSVINELFDHKDSYREERRHSLKEPIDIPRPMTTLLVGSQPGFLGTLLPEAAWTMGWTSRLLMVYASEVPDTPLFGTYTAQDEIQKTLITKLEECSRYYGEMKWDGPAISEIESWKKTGFAPIPDHPKLANYVPRRGRIFAFKLAMISAMSRGEEKVIRRQDVERARGWLLEIETLMPQIFRDMVMRSDDQVIEETFQFCFTMYLKNRKPIPGSMILRFLSQRTPAEKAERILSLMEKSGMFERMAGQEAYVPLARERHGMA